MYNTSSVFHEIVKAYDWRYYYKMRLALRVSLEMILWLFNGFRAFVSIATPAKLFLYIYCEQQIILAEEESVSHIGCSHVLDFSVISFKVSSLLLVVMSRQQLYNDKNIVEKIVMLSCVCFSDSWAQRWVSVEWSCQTWSLSCCVWGETATRKPLSSIRWRRHSMRPKACWIRRVKLVCSSGDHQQNYNGLKHLSCTLTLAS